MTADRERPNYARVCDYLLGGTTNYRADQAHARLLSELYPAAPVVARASRAFTGRAVRWAARGGIRQFIGIGSGLPTSLPGLPAPHEAARETCPQARYVYADADPEVRTLGRGMLHGTPDVMVVTGDIRDPRRVLGACAGFLDPARPLGVVMTAVLQFLSPAEAQDAVAGWKNLITPGSCMIISCPTSEWNPELIARYEDLRSRCGHRIRGHSIRDITRFFDGLDLDDPSWGPQEGGCVVPVGQWRTEGGGLRQPDPVVYGGLGWKTSAATARTESSRTPRPG